MFFQNKKILLGLFLLIFFIIGSVSASEEISSDCALSQEDNNLIQITEDNLDSSNEITDEVISSDELNYDGNPFINPNFDEGELNTPANIYGWDTYQDNIYGGSSGSVPATSLQIVNNTNPNNKANVLTYEGNVLRVEMGSNTIFLTQNINFDSIDNISFKYLPEIKKVVVSRYIDILIDGEKIESIDLKGTFGNSWSECTLNVANYSGNHLFVINVYNPPSNIYFENFTIGYNDKLSSNFNHANELHEESISVQFTNRATGLNIKYIYWDFGDGTNSTEINPVHTFKSGDYTVTLTVANENNADTYSTVLSLKYPTINGQMYSSVQDAIDNAEAGAVIDIPNDISENLNINQTVTLNFNGNKLTGSINVNDGAMVTLTNISDVSSVSTDDSSKLTIVDSNINSNLELKSGNIDLNSVNFNNSILTITAANTTLVNVNVANGGIVINGGKSKITKSNFTDSTNVITQNDGELELINNIIKNNNNAINITGGSATISYNAIYNNTGDLTLTGATVTNNWFGTNQVTGYESYLRLVFTSTDSEMYPDSEYTIKVEFVPNTGSMDGALNDLTLDITSTNGEITSPIIITDNQGELKFTAGAISDEVKFILLGEEYTLVNDEYHPVSIVAKPLDTSLSIESTEKGSIVITLKDSEGNAISGANVNYTINGGETLSNVTDATGKFAINDLTGLINIVANYAGNKTYNPTNNAKSFDFKLNIDMIIANESKVITITLKDENGKAVVGVNVNYTINGGETLSNVTDANGEFTISDLPDEYIEIKFNYPGDDTYNANVTSMNFNFTVPQKENTTNNTSNATNTNGNGGSTNTNTQTTTTTTKTVKVASKIVAKKKTFKVKTKTKKYKITLKTKSGKAIKKVKVTLKVKGKTYKAKTNAKGVATFKITKLNKKGKYTAKIKFAGNKSYKATSKKIKLTVKK